MRAPFIAGFLIAAFPVAVFGAANAYAEDAPPAPAPATTAEPPAAPTAPPAPPPAPPAAPSPDETRRVIQQTPPTAPVYSGPAPYYTAPYTAPCAPPCAPPPCCFQPRDECGCAVDSCGQRYCPWMLTLEGGASSYSSPDGILGERMFIPGHQLAWDDVDYPISFGGRVTLSYRYECLSRVEIRGTYYGNPDDGRRDAGFFAARPGALGIGDISRPVIADFSADAELWSGEFNWWTELMCSNRWRMDAGMGLRYVSFDENARVDFVSTGPGAFPVDNGFVLSEVKNHWFGGQLCFAAHNDISQCLEFTASFKGLFGTVRREVDITDQDIFSGGRHFASVDDDEFVFGLDVELGLRYRISRLILIGVAYNFFFLDNVQRAEDAMDFGLSNSGSVQAIQNPDQLVVHSIFLGVTFNF